MKILVTGASGFIGSQVTSALLSAGHEVAALVRPQTSLQRLQGIKGQIIRLQADLGDSEALRPVLEQWRPEACIHLAWYAEPGQYLHSSKNVAFLRNSLTFLEELGRAGCAQVVAAGTCAEYDSERGWLHEDGPTKPETLYAASKLSLCQIGQHLAALSGGKFAWARIFYPYGPGEDARRAVPALIGALLRGESFPASEGLQVRDYLHVADIASAFCRLVQEQATGIYNISSGNPVTMRRVMETVGEILGRKDLIQFGAAPARAWDPPFICGDSRRLRALGWAPSFGLEDGLRATVDWWQAQPSGASP